MIDREHFVGTRIELNQSEPAANDLFAMEEYEKSTT